MSKGVSLYGWCIFQLTAELVYSFVLDETNGMQYATSDTISLTLFYSKRLLTHVSTSDECFSTLLLSLVTNWEKKDLLLNVFREWLGSIPGFRAGGSQNFARVGNVDRVQNSKPWDDFVPSVSFTQTQSEPLISLTTEFYCSGVGYLTCILPGKLTLLSEKGAPGLVTNLIAWTFWYWKNGL